MESIFQYLAEILKAVGNSQTALAALMFTLLAVLASLLFKDSKGLSGLSAFVALLAFAFFVVITFNKASPPAFQRSTSINPLQVGNYESDSYYLEVLQRGERICIRVMSRNASTVASVYVDSNNPNFYQVPNYSDWNLMQKSATTISFGGRDYTREAESGFPQNIDQVEQDCLGSKNRFFVNTPNKGR